jgi:hypothetical protein
MKLKLYFLITIYFLVLTYNSELFFQKIDPASGNEVLYKKYDIGNNEKLTYLQFTISSRFKSAYIIHRIENITNTNPEYQKIAINVFSTTTFTQLSEGFNFNEAGKPYSIATYQTLGSEQMLIKGILDTGANDTDKRFTLSLHPQLHTIDLLCDTSLTSTFTSPTTTLPTTNKTTTPTFTDIISNKIISPSTIVYAGSPTALVPAQICTLQTFTSLEQKHKIDGP